MNSHLITGYRGELERSVEELASYVTGMVLSPEKTVNSKKSPKNLPSQPSNKTAKIRQKKKMSGVDAMNGSMSEVNKTKKEKPTKTIEEERDDDTPSPLIGGDDDEIFTTAGDGDDEQEEDDVEIVLDMGQVEIPAVVCPLRNKYRTCITHLSINFSIRRRRIHYRTTMSRRCSFASQILFAASSKKITKMMVVASRKWRQCRWRI